MIFIDVLADEELQTVVNKLISGMLPHENFKPSVYNEILTSIFKLIKLEEFSGEYYILLDVLQKYADIGNSHPTFGLRLIKDTLEEILQANIQDLVSNESVRTTSLLLEAGYDANLALENTFTEACQLLYTRTIDLYDKCLELKIPSEEALGYKPAYKSSFLRHVGEQSLRAQTTILSDVLKVGKVEYRGSSGWLDFSVRTLADTTDRIKAEDDTFMVVKSQVDSDALLDSNANQFTKLADYGIPPIDDFTPILTHRLVVVCANENVGKTASAIHMACSLLVEGKKVLWICGENTRGNVYAKMLSNYIYRTRGIYITAVQLAKRKTMLPQDKQQLVALAKTELDSKGLLGFKDIISYENAEEELTSIYKEFQFDAVVIDHTGALKGGPHMEENVSRLAVNLREFKKKFPVCIITLSHLSVVAKDLLARDKQVVSSPTAFSSTLSKEADEIFILHKNAELDKRGLLAFYNYKRRDASVVVDEIILRKKFNVSAYEYDETIQVANTGFSTSAESVLKMIEDSVEGDELNEEYIPETNSNVVMGDNISLDDGLSGVEFDDDYDNFDDDFDDFE